MTFFDVATLIASIWVLACGAVVVWAATPLYSVLALLGVIGGLSVWFLLLGFQLLSLIQIYVYAGAVVTLMLLVVMLLSLQPDAKRSVQRLGAGSLAILAVAGLAGLLLRAVWGLERGSLGARAALMTPLGLKEMARQLFTTYLLQFEMTSFLMLVAVVGAVSLLRRPDTRRPPSP